MTKHNSILLLIFVLAQLSVSSQNYRYGYLLEFSDKENSSFSVDNPEEFLSQRAIDRRQKNNISISEQDFPVNSIYTDSILHLNAKLHVTSRWFNSAVFLTNDPMFVDEVQFYSFVNRVTLVYENNSTKNATLSSKWTKQTNDLQYGEATTQITMCNAQVMHNRGFLGEDIQIAVLDGGFWRVDELACFDSLWHNNRILATWDFVAGNDSVFEDNSHGMGVLSIMASNLPNELMGTAPNASYYLYRTENVSTEYLIEEENWIAAAEVADSAGTDIITASLGYSTYDNASMSHTYANMDGKTTRITRGAEIAFSKGIFLINSAGNEGNNNWKYITAPSDGENVLCIGAVDEDETLADFSSRGPSYDNRTKPDVVAKGLATALISSDGTVRNGNGTSYSAPVMAGMVACLWQALPDYSNKKILDLIRSIGDRNKLPDNSYGYGLPDFSKLSFMLDSARIPKENDAIIKIYTNPFYDELAFNVYIEKTQEVKIFLQNTQGQQVYFDSQQLTGGVYNLVQINGLSRLESGCYILSIHTNFEIITEKIVRL